jgi:hypothetical protein
MHEDRSTFNSQEIPSFDENRNLGPLGRVYKFHHTRRFEWLRSKIASIHKQKISVLELGCNDARSVGYIPVPIERYVGLDAGWRSGWRNGKAFGLEAACQRFRDVPRFEFHRSEHFEDLESVYGTFDVAVVLETFEYLEPAKLEAYVTLLSRKLKSGGCIFSTMPNEKGLPLLLKVIGSKLSGVPRSEYTASQFWNAFLGRMEKVPRSVHGRKGFDYIAMARLLSRHFSHVQLESVEPAKAPLWLGLNIGLVACKDEAPSPGLHCKYSCHELSV